MIITTTDANRNGLSRTDNRRPEEAGLEWHQSRQGVGRESAHTGIMGAGQTPTLRDGTAKAEGNHLSGAFRTAIAGETAFEALLSEHEAEAEYQGYLQEVEAEHLSRQAEEDAVFQAAHLFSRGAAAQALNGEGVAA